MRSRPALRRFDRFSPARSRMRHRHRRARSASAHADRTLREPRRNRRPLRARSRRSVFPCRTSSRTAVGGRFGSLERGRHSKRDVLAVVTNDIVFKRRPPLFADAFHSLLQDRAGDLADVLAMKDRAHAGHLLGRRRVEWLRIRRLAIVASTGTAYSNPGKVEVGGVLRFPGHFQRAVDARRVCDRSATLPEFLVSATCFAPSIK